ncbi:Monocarboxylate transporter 10 [Lamellibrachia satsuma]|nr:Monocarboxylate transporter 10 [Lamellibrachia satsuma]
MEPRRWSDVNLDILPAAPVAQLVPNVSLCEEANADVVPRVTMVGLVGGDDGSNATSTQATGRKLYDGDDVPRKASRDSATPEGGYGWVVVAASFYASFVVFGIINTFGVMFTSVKEEYGMGMKKAVFKTSWVGSLMMSVTFFMSPIASILIDRIGIQSTALIGSVAMTVGMIGSAFVPNLDYLYFTLGMMFGTGASFVYNPAIVILGQYFEKRMGIVNGIVCFGSSSATILLPFALTKLLNTVGVRKTIRLLTVMPGLLIICTFLWRPLRSPRHTELDHYLILSRRSTVIEVVTGYKHYISKFLNLRIFRNRNYVVWVAGVTIICLGYAGPYVHMVKHASQVMPDQDGGILIVCIGAASGISRIVCGRIADLSISRIRMMQIAFVIMGVATSCLALPTQFYQITFLAIVLGLGDGCFVCLLGPIAFDLLGPGGAAQGIGCLFNLMSITMTAGPPIMGILYEIDENYRLAFPLCGIPFIIGASFFFFIKMDKKVGEHARSELT